MSVSQAAPGNWRRDCRPEVWCDEALFRRFGARRLIAAAGAGALLSAGLGAAAASAADRTASAVAGPPATSVALSPCGIKYAAGNLYIGAGDAVYKVSEQTGRATSIAPGQLSPVSYEAPQACGVAVDGAGNVLVANGPDVVVVAAKTGTFYGRRMTAGRVYSVAFGFLAVSGARTCSSTGPATWSSPWAAPGRRTPTTSRTRRSSCSPSGPRLLRQEDGQGQALPDRGRAERRRGSALLRAGRHGRGGRRRHGRCRQLDAAAAAGAPPRRSRPISATRSAISASMPPGTSSSPTAPGTGPARASELDIPPRVAVIPARTGAYSSKMTVGYLYTIAGLGARTGNGVPAVGSDLTGVTGVAVDHAERPGRRHQRADPLGGVRVIAARTGTFYGQKMRKGYIYALPGLAYADTLAVDDAGNVLVGEGNYLRVQMLAVKTGAYYGVKARAGRVYTIAGNGKAPV